MAKPIPQQGSVVKWQLQPITFTRAESPKEESVLGLVYGNNLFLLSPLPDKERQDQLKRNKHQYKVRHQGNDVTHRNIRIRVIYLEYLGPVE